MGEAAITSIMNSSVYFGKKYQVLILLSGVGAYMFLVGVVVAHWVS